MVELREPLDDPDRAARPTSPRGTTFPRAREIRLYDTTLRDGEQTPGVAFTPEQKYELAGMLSDAGVHIIDMGFPSAAPSERRALELILEGKKKGRIRAGPRDHRDVPLQRAGHRRHPRHPARRWGRSPSDCTFFIFTSGSDLHLKYKIGKTLLQLEGRKPEEWLDLPGLVLPRGQHQHGLHGHRATRAAAAWSRSSSAARTARARTSTT